MIRNPTLTILVVSTVLTIFGVLPSLAQAPDAYENLGNGAVKIVTRIFSVGEKLTLHPDLDTSSALPKTYLIKNHLVLSQNQFELREGKLVSRTEAIKRDTTVMGNQTFISVVIPSYIKYMIDWKDRKKYIFTADSISDTIYRLPLKEPSLDMYYNMLSKGNWARELKLSGDKKEIIAGHVCSTGIAVHENGMETLFYYTTDPIGIVSPLNGFISPKEKINVMAVFGEIQFQGSSVKSNILLKLEEILEKTLDNQFFQLPDKAPIKDVKSMDEFIIQRRRLKRS